MAIDYDLTLDSDIGPRELVELAFPHLVSSVYEDQSPGGGLLVRLDTDLVLVVARVENDERSREIEREMFDINARVILSFRLDKVQTGEAAQQMAGAVVRVLRAIPGDAILVLNDEAPRARRRGKEGVLSEHSSFWTPETLEQLGPGWRIGPDPGPTNL